MLIDTLTARLRLARRQPARLDDARDSVLTCVDGDLWITVDGDRRDIVLSPGESFVVESDEHVVVFPLQGAATLDVRGGSRRADVNVGPAPRVEALRNPSVLVAVPSR